MVSAAIERHKLPWSKLANVTTDGLPKNVGLLKRIQDKVTEENPEQDVIFLHCIIHQESLCTSILQLNHVVNPVVKPVNFIRARGLQHRQFIKFLEETDADHQELLYHSCLLVEFGQSASTSVGPERGDWRLSRWGNLTNFLS
ncbi:hypothetical protein HF521_015985 [Silurus meridionalis]|uniref:Uncharacterized protein n=1 Tax=Silurus meridionalis TaxID=175797 RepID=A0A8T0BQL7_SILME|nr:hypothetical protein HF521_015985 [Silurus meridionalis]